MKKILILCIPLIAGLLSGVAFAGKVNPTSHVTADTTATADTIVLRDSSGNMSIVAADISIAAVTTAKVSVNAVTTAKFYMDIIPMSAACITTSRELSNCTSAVSAEGTCSCN